MDDLQLATASVWHIFKHFKVTIGPDLKERYREEISADFKNFYYRHGFPCTVTSEEMNAVRREFFKKHRRLGLLRHDAVKTLTACQILGTLKLAIVSGEIEETLLKRLWDTNLNGYFEKVWADVRNKEIALVKACHHFKVSPAETFYVDDTREGITASSRCGVIPVSLVNPTSYTPEKYLRETARQYQAIVIANLFDITRLL